MEWSGFAPLLLVGAGIIGTGLPAAIVLIMAASVGAALGLMTDTIPVSLLGALPGRLINLFESDLLQALPLYVTMGLLLNRLPLADALYRGSMAVLPRSPSAPAPAVGARTSRSPGTGRRAGEQGRSKQTTGAPY